MHHRRRSSSNNNNNNKTADKTANNKREPSFKARVLVALVKGTLCAFFDGAHRSGTCEDAYSEPKKSFAFFAVKSAKTLREKKKSFFGSL
jgi:hypothetical protein